MLCILTNYKSYATSRNLLTAEELENVTLYMKLCNEHKNMKKITNITFVHDTECKVYNSSDVKLPVYKKFNAIQGVIHLANLVCCAEFISFVNTHKCTSFTVDRNILLELNEATKEFEKMTEW